MEIDELAARVDAIGAALGGHGRRLADAGPGPAAFGGDGPGRVGEVGRALHRQWSAALVAREREAAAHGARLGEFGAALRSVADAYREVDDAARRRLRHRGGSDGSP
jgi:hypothetical protein